MGVLTVITTLLPLLLSLLGSSNLLSPKLTGLITTLSGAVPTLIANLIAGKGITADILVLLQSVQTTVTALRTTPGVLTVEQSNLIEAFDGAITDAMTEYNEALLKDDPSNLTPLPEVL